MTSLLLEIRQALCGLVRSPGYGASVVLTLALTTERVRSGSFTLLATQLAATGLYATLAYSVAQRTRESGMRQALGATPGRLRAMVLSQVGWMGVIGGVVGLVFAVMLGRAAESVLFGLSGYEPTVLAAAVLVFGTVVIAAGYLPARHASKVDPLEALRYE